MSKCDVCLDLSKGKLTDNGWDGKIKESVETVYLPSVIVGQNEPLNVCLEHREAMRRHK